MNLVAVTFVTSPSHLFPVALSIAEQASDFKETPVGKVTRYQTRFAATQVQAELAVSLLQHLDNIKGVLIHAGGRLIVDHEAVISTIGCFISAQAGGGVEHYCHKAIVVRDPEAEHKNMFESGFYAPPRYVVPCAKLLQSGFVPDVIVGDAKAQLLAEAARQGCDWCPNFKPEAFKKLKG